MTVSPKPHFHGAGESLVGARDLRPNECKVVVDDAVDAAALQRWESQYSSKKSRPQLFLQPCWGDGYDASLAKAVELISLVAASAATVAVPVASNVRRWESSFSPLGR